ncbi:MAG: hypothetical protein ACE5JQ_14560 [Candidatus Methylomirabilales bacterium]
MEEGTYKRMQEHEGHLVIMVGALTVANIFREMRSALLKAVARKERLASVEGKVIAKLD